jgi:hypothetical protein
MTAPVATNDAWFRVTDEVAEASRIIILLMLQDVPPDEAWPLLIQYHEHLQHLTNQS